MDWGLIGRAVAGGIGGAAGAAEEIADKDIDLDNKASLAKTMADLDVEKQKRIEENTHAANVQAAAGERTRRMNLDSGAKVDPNAPAFTQEYQRGQYALSQGDTDTAKAHLEMAKGGIDKIGYGQETGDIGTGNRVDEWGSSMVRGAGRGKAALTPEQKAIQMNKLESGYDAAAKSLVTPVKLPTYAADPMDLSGEDKDAPKNIKLLALNLAQAGAGDSGEYPPASAVIPKAVAQYKAISTAADQAVGKVLSAKDGTPLIQGDKVDQKLAVLLSQQISANTKGQLTIPADQLVGDSNNVKSNVFKALRDFGVNNASKAGNGEAAPTKAAPSTSSSAKAPDTSIDDLKSKLSAALPNQNLAPASKFSLNSYRHNIPEAPPKTISRGWEQVDNPDYLAWQKKYGDVAAMADRRAKFDSGQ